MTWWQKFLVSVASLVLAFVAGHFLWPATTLVEIPGKVILDSAATQALTLDLENVRSELTVARANVVRDRAALSRTRAMYADLAARLDSIENAQIAGPVEWPAAAYDTTMHKVVEFVAQVGDSVERRDVLQEIRLTGSYVLPPVGRFQNVAVHITPSMVYFSRQLPGQKLEVREVVRWPWLPVVAGYLGGTIVTALIAFLVSR